MKINVVSVFFLVLFPTLSLAEDAGRGTLPDGRAYRTDNAGNQLVDYIAELEVNVDSLEQRIYGLQDQLAEKNATIERIQAGGSACPKVEERDLNSQAPTNCAAQIAPLQANISTLRAELTKEQELHRKDIAFYEASLESSKEPAAKCKVQVASLEKDIRDLNAKLATATSVKAAAREPVQPQIVQPQTMAALRPTQPLAEPVYRSTIPQRGSSFSARERAVESIRSDVSGDLTRLKMSISTRDALFAQFDQRGKAMQIRPNQAVSSRKKNVADIARELSSASSVRELAGLKNDVQEISAKVNDDIALVRRLSRKG